MTKPPDKTLFPGQESIGRWVGLVILGGATARSALAAPPLTELSVVTIRWALVTGLFALFTLAYVRRPKATALASRPIEILLPLLVASLPYVQDGPPRIVFDLLRGVESMRSVMSYLFRPVGSVIGEVPALTMMAVGEAFAVYSMTYLGRSFSIFTEVRRLVTTGPYRLVRHPLYAGELVAIWGYSLVYATRWSLGAAVLITGLQAWRARVEERKLAEHLPEYAEYRDRTGFLWPRLLGRS